MSRLNNAPVLRERDFFFTWLLFSVCNVVASGAIGFVAGGVAGLILVLIGITPKSDPTHFKMITAGAGFVVSLPVSYSLFRHFVSQLWQRKHAGSDHPAPAGTG